MSALSYDIATTRVLWRRDLMRFWREPTRLIGALAQPIILWLIIGTGFAATFRIPSLDISYPEFFFPGVLVMVALFASIFGTVSVINDRHEVFLQAVLAGPGSRFSIVLGKCLGTTTIAMLQTAIFVGLAPLAGFEMHRIDWAMLGSALVLTSLALTALSFAVAWLIDSVRGYHAIQMTLLVPLWVVSGAMFPAGSELYATVMQLNPISYGVSATRHALYGGAAPAITVVATSPWTSVAIIGLFALVALFTASVACRRHNPTP